MGTSPAELTKIVKNLKLNLDNGVGPFLDVIENAATVYQVDTDDQKIEMAKIVLCMSTKDVNILNFTRMKFNLSDTWPAFKEHLNLFESKTQDTFRCQFQTYQRQENQSAASLMTNLIHLYKKLSSFDSTYTLTKSDTLWIYRRFVSC